MSAEPMHHTASARWKRSNPEKHRAGVKRRRARDLSLNPQVVLDRELAARSRFRERHPDGRWFRTLQAHGLTPEQYWALFKEQMGVCAICHEPEKQYAHLAVDHDHATGRVRGLLCFGCNKMLGYARDQASMLIAAAAYVEKKPQLELVAREV